LKSHVGTVDLLFRPKPLAHKVLDVTIPNLPNARPFWAML
jgi:hypothetical protein